MDDEEVRDIVGDILQTLEVEASIADGKLTISISVLLPSSSIIGYKTWQREILSTSEVELPHE
jgi:hypothetical protein